MKNAGRCPKCGSTNILRVEGKAGAYGSGNNIITGFTIFPQCWFTAMSAVNVATARNGSTGKTFPNCKIITVRD